MPSGIEWVILLVVLVLLFGASRLPEMARAVGRSAHVLRGELKGTRTDDGDASPTRPAPGTTNGSSQPVRDPAPGATNGSSQPVRDPAPGATNGSGQPERG